MPGGDQRGPEGKGPMTGRGMGRCNTGKSATETNMPRRGRCFGGGAGRGFGRGGMGRGNRRGFGRGNRLLDSLNLENPGFPESFSDPMNSEAINLMKKQTSMLEKELNAIRMELESLKNMQSAEQEMEKISPKPDSNE